MSKSYAYADKWKALAALSVSQQLDEPLYLLVTWHLISITKEEFEENK